MKKVMSCAKFYKNIAYFFHTKTFMFLVFFVTSLKNVYKHFYTKINLYGENQKFEKHAIRKIGINHPVFHRFL